MTNIVNLRAFIVHNAARMGKFIENLAFWQMMGGTTPPFVSKNYTIEPEL